MISYLQQVKRKQDTFKHFKECSGKRTLDIMSITRKKLLKKKDIVQNSKFSSENRNPMVFPTSGKFYCNTSVGYAGFQTRTPAYTPHFRGTRKDFQAKKFILLRKQSQLAPSPEDPGKLI